MIHLVILLPEGNLQKTWQLLRKAAVFWQFTVELRWLVFRRNVKICLSYRNFEPLMFWNSRDKQMKSGSNPGQFRYAMINKWCPGQWSFEVKKKIWSFKKFSKATASEYPFDIFKLFLETIFPLFLLTNLLTGNTKSGFKLSIYNWWLIQGDFLDKFDCW